MNSSCKNIIWDWNGTLLDDVSICVTAMNRLLSERGLPLLTIEHYRNVFTFPVKEYYKQIGFDFSKEAFDIPALKFIDYYHELLPSIGLFSKVNDVLKNFKEKGYNQFILSAMEQESLVKSVCNLGISDYFESIVGIDNHFAHSKVERGKHLIERVNLKKVETVMIGDTLHDVEVAETLGIECVLIAKGHQSAARISVNGNTIIDDLGALGNLL